MASETIGRYAIKSQLGQGGMATVYQAHDPSIKRDVAIKVLPRTFLHDPTFRARFEREAQVVAQLEHSAIVPVYDFGEDDGQPFLVMRLMTGGTLAERIQRGPMSVEEAIPIIERLAGALDRAHRQGIIHRDIKPGNVLFDQDGDAYLSDFGIVKMASSSASVASLTGEGRTIGTPAYMSPEQTQGKHELDGRSDIYALGVILFEMLTGDVPYQADTPIAVAVKHVMEPVPRILEFNRSLPSGFDRVITTSMAKNPEQRYENGKDMAAALREATTEVSLATPSEAPTMDVYEDTLPMDSDQDVVLAEQPALSVPAPAVEAAPQAERSPRRFGCLTTALVGVAVLLVAGATVGGILALTGTLAFGNNQTADRLRNQGADGEEPPPLVSSSVTLVPDSGGEGDTGNAGSPTAEALATEFSSEPSGTILFTCFISGFDEVCSINSDGSNEQRLTTDTATDWYASWSVDGSQVLFSSRRDNVFAVYSMNPSGSSLQRLTQNLGDNFSPDLSPDGTRVAFTADNSDTQNIWVMNSDGTNPTRITHGGGCDSLDPDWSPDGTRIAFASECGGTWELYTMLPNGNDVVQLTSGFDIGGRNDWSPDGTEIAFYALRLGTYEVFIVDIDGSNLRQITVGGDNKAPIGIKLREKVTKGSNSEKI